MYTTYTPSICHLLKSTSIEFAWSISTWFNVKCIYLSMYVCVACVLHLLVYHIHLSLSSRNLSCPAGEPAQLYSSRLTLACQPLISIKFVSLLTLLYSIISAVTLSRKNSKFKFLLITTSKRRIWTSNQRYRSLCRCALTILILS